MSEPVWTTREGETVPLSQMEDSHLLNAEAWAERRAGELRDEAEQARSYAIGASDAAGDAAEAEASFGGMMADALLWWVERFEAEIKRRKLR